jgi:hypothetical protein
MTFLGELRLLALYTDVREDKKTYDTASEL